MVTVGYAHDARLRNCLAPNRFFLGKRGFTEHAPQHHGTRHAVSHCGCMLISAR